MTEVVLERTFDIKQAQKIIDEDNLNVSLTDSGYAYHINSKWCRQRLWVFGSNKNA